MVNLENPGEEEHGKDDDLTEEEEGEAEGRDGKYFVVAFAQNSLQFVHHLTKPNCTYMAYYEGVQKSHSRNPSLTGP